MAELRWNPFLRTWVIIASHRQARPDRERDYCPFCPGSGKVPDDFDVYAYPNDFPALMLEPPEPDIQGDHVIPVKPAFGKCEVTLYSPKHDVTLPSLPLDHIEKLVYHWEERYREIGAIKGIDYVFIFENRGEAVGVTMLHPHGQIYGYSWVPLKIKTELDSAKDYTNRTGRCLFCDLARREINIGQRIVFSQGGFTAFVPPFAEYPYEVHLLLDRHAGSIAELNAGEKKGLAYALKCITGAYDSLFDIPFPYMMCMHQLPTDGNDYPYYHFHLEFYPPMRNSKSLKYNASSETGAWAAANPTKPEDKAAELREMVEKFSASLGIENI